MAGSAPWRAAPAAPRVFPPVGRCPAPPRLSALTDAGPGGASGGGGGEAERSPKFRLYRPAQHPAVRRMIWAPPRSLSMGSGGGGGVGQEEQRITPGTRASEDPLTDRRIHRLSS